MVDPPSDPAGPPTQTVAMADGTRLHVVHWPSPGTATVPFLLVHGLASNARTWAAVARRLWSAGHTVATVDLRGHGQSDRPDSGYDFATLCDDIERVVEALGFAHPVIAGQSTGGNLALELGRRAGRLAGVVGVDGGVIELQRRWPSWEECADALAPPRWDGITADELRDRLRRRFPIWTDEGVEATMASFAVDPDGTVRPHLTRDRHLAILRALWEHRPSAVVGAVPVPVLLVLADADGDDAAVRRADAEEAAAGLAQARVHWLAGSDHDVHVQQPDTLSELMLAAVADGFFVPPPRRS